MGERGVKCPLLGNPPFFALSSRLVVVGFNALKESLKTEGEMQSKIAALSIAAASNPLHFQAHQLAISPIHCVFSHANILRALAKYSQPCEFSLGNGTNKQT